MAGATCGVSHGAAVNPDVAPAVALRAQASAHPGYAGGAGLLAMWMPGTSLATTVGRDRAQRRTAPPALSSVCGPHPFSATFVAAALSAAGCMPGPASSGTQTGRRPI